MSDRPSLDARSEILGRITRAIADCPKSDPPPEVAAVWPADEPRPPDLAERFCRELDLVSGEGRVCAGRDELAVEVARRAADAGWDLVGVADHPLCRAAAASLDPARTVLVQPGHTALELSRLAAGIVPAEYLLADTGTAVLAPRTAAERLLCYLPPVGMVVAPRDRLVYRMTEMWHAVVDRSRAAVPVAEVLLVTGPSRTADIEKTLVLGAHGPKQLIVWIIDPADGREARSDDRG